jgi:fructokinase
LGDDPLTLRILMGPVVVSGECLVDLIVDPAGGLHAALGGGPYNTARTIGRLGGDVAFLGRLSRDRFGGHLLAGLHESNVDTRLVVVTDDPSTLAMAELEPDGSARYRFYVTRTAAPGLSEEQALRALELRPWALHLGTLGLVFEPIASSLEALVGRLSPEALVMLDPNARPSATPDAEAWRARIGRLARQASVVRLTTDDLAFLRPGVGPIEAAAGLLALGPLVVILTDGPATVQVLTRDGDRLAIPVPPVPVVDTVGSGDAFGGAFLAWWQAHELTRADLVDPAALEAAIRAAIRVASTTCARVGADPPTLGELGGWTNQSIVPRRADP